MSKRSKPVSAQDKRIRMLEIFQETQDFWQLKELEKMAPKLKGIVSQSVKEVVEGLVSDGLVITEKVGTSNYFWSYPSTQYIAVYIAIYHSVKVSWKMLRNNTTRLFRKMKRSNWL